MTNRLERIKRVKPLMESLDLLMQVKWIVRDTKYKEDDSKKYRDRALKQLEYAMTNIRLARDTEVWDD